MRVLLITMLYDPDHAGIAPITTDLSRGLVERGHEVTVHTTHPYYPEWKRKSDASPWRVQQETVEGVEVRRFGLFVPSSPSRLLPRLLHEMSFPISLMRSLFDRRRFDAVIVFCPLLGAVAFAALRKLVRREPLWINVQDIPVDAAVGTGIGKWGILKRLANFIQRTLLGRADELSSISPTMVQRLETLQSTRHDVHLHPNWLGEGLAGHIDRLPSKTGRIAGERTRILYAGNIGKKQGLLDFCKELAATDLDFDFRINGDGGEAESLREWIAAADDRRFTVGPFLDEGDFVQALHDTDLFVITEKPGAGASFMPSKLIPCISTGTPVLALCDREGPLGLEMAQHELGFLAKWNDTQAVAKAIDSCRDARTFTHLQENCIRRSRIYRRARALDFAETLLTQLTEPRATWLPAEQVKRRTP